MNFSHILIKTLHDDTDLFLRVGIFCINSLTVTNLFDQVYEELDDLIIISNVELKEDTNSEYFSSYMDKIKRFKLLKVCEEEDLVMKMRNGDNAARDTLINSNLRLVVKIAHDFKGRGLVFEDLISEGNIGLIKAIDKYRLNKGAKISTYAALWIKQNIRRAISNQSRTVRIPVQSYNKLLKIKTTVNKFKEDNRREPSDEETSAITGISIKTISNLHETLSTAVYLDDTPVDSNSSYHNIFSNKVDEILQGELYNELHAAIADLTPREQLIIKSRFGLEDGNKTTLNDLSEMVGRTRERVRQIQHIALNKLRGRLRSRLGSI